MSTSAESPTVNQRRMSVGVAVRLLGLLVAVWGTVLAAVGVYGFSISVTPESSARTNQLAQVTTSEELRQPLSQESSPEIASDVVTAQIDQSGSGWSISVDAAATNQVQEHNPRITVGQLDLLQQIVPLRIRAENVRQVTPVIRNEQTLEETRLSPAQELSDGAWVHEWSVADVPAGRYRVQIDIEPEQGERYMAYDGSVYQLPSHSEREAALAAGRESVEALYDSLEEIRTAMNDRPAPEARPTLFIPQSDQARGTVTVYLEATTPATLQRQTSPDSWETVGAFAPTGEGQEMALDTTVYADGWHALRAVESATQSVLTSVQPIRISNTPAATLVTTDNRTVDERVHSDSGLSSARVEASQVLVENDVASTRDISGDDYTEATSLLLTIWPEYRQDVNQFSDGLATALRAEEEQSIKRAVQRFRDLEADIVSSLDGRRQVVIDAVQQIVRNRLNERILRVEQAERYVTLLVSQANNATTTVPVDSVLSDPAVSFYAFGTTTKQTPAPEHQEPRTAGVTRADLLQVQSIATTTAAGSSTATGVLRGTALPNSTVRLFIYSNPVVVTLNTNADGTWEYQFDTELEDGEHEVYVALTDGVGQVVARSNPFRFAKTAQAFSPVDRIAAGSVSQSNQAGVSLMNWPLIYLIVSLSVVVIGFLLMVVGATVRSRENNNVVIKTKILP